MYKSLSADMQNANWTSPVSYEFDNVADGGAPIKYDKNLLTGDDGKESGLVRFSAAEIEVWQL